MGIDEAGLGDFMDGLEDICNTPYDMQIAGDFYREADDVTRGCTVLNPDMMNSMDDDLLLDDRKASMFDHGYNNCYNEPFKFNDGCCNDIQAPVRFSETAEPATLPSECQAVTSVRLAPSTSAAKAAACTHKFLVEAGARIAKVRPEKFSINANVFQEVGGSLLLCSLKVRVFKIRSSGILTLDFCRRRGDAVAFGSVFNEAVRYLQANPGIIAPAEVPARMNLPRLPATVDANGSELQLEPLLDMLKDCSSPARQAEAATALAAAAGASSAVCTLLASSRLTGLLAGLLTSADHDVTFPVERLVAVLPMTVKVLTPH